MSKLLVASGIALACIAACGDDEDGAIATATQSATSSTASSGATGGSGATPSAGGSGGGVGGMGGFALTSPAFDEGDTIPAIHTCDTECARPMMGAQDSSPPLEWTQGPEAAQSYAIVMRDLDYMNGFVHWVLWDIPAATTLLAEDVDKNPQPVDLVGASQALGGYLGPCSCAPSAVNTYEFTLHALDVANLTGINAGAPKEDAAAVVEAASIASASLSGES
jgi:hypothetical protein